MPADRRRAPPLGDRRRATARPGRPPPDGRLEEAAPSCRSARRGSTASSRQRGGERHPGKPAAATRDPGAASAPSRAAAGRAVRLSTTCPVATAAGSRIAVRLIALVQASSSRTWPSIAARAASRERRSRVADEPAASRATSYAAGAVECPGRASGAARACDPTARLLWFACHRGAAPLPASTRLAPWALVRSSAVHPVRGRVSPCPSWTALPSRRPSAGSGPYGPRRGPSTGLSTNSPTARWISWISQRGATGGAPVGRRRPEAASRMSRRVATARRAAGVTPACSEPRRARSQVGRSRRRRAARRRRRRSPSAADMRPAGPGRTSTNARADARTARDVELAAHRARQIPRDRQAQAGAGDPLVVGHPVEALEDPRLGRSAPIPGPSSRTAMMATGPSNHAGELDRRAARRT